ncbi:hypothetical protein D8Y22_17665 [Salinadaptatus halalkaliphilus]|uniref:Uncharacterized protein n=1 Tax=Salinadaptatus halalkaliphilus TaxID=2419781 RepID=A0A4S3TJC2_9EURY|nr:hypothetical protein [Salinadaptatus halalkaliphilus]THE63640.1 hypothetical protein D8Y22_17665 [Salinadaptatus halalkaliphilus]
MTYSKPYESGTSDDGGSDSTDDAGERPPDEDSNDDSTDDDERNDTAPEDIVESYIEAARDEDLEGIEAAVHSESPLDPSGYADEDLTVDFDGIPATGDYETETVTEDATAADVLALEDASFFFGEDDLERALGNETRLVALEWNTESDANEAVWVLTTEDGEWVVFWIGEEDETPDNPEAVFDDPIEDEDGDVLKRIEYDVDAGDGFEDGHADDSLVFAEVHLTDDPGLEADRIEVETTIEGYEGSVEGAWADAWLLVSLHDEGDQIVVTAVVDGDDEIVHREHYTPA